MPNLIYCQPDRLRIHPDNMRRSYPDRAVQEMADSILAAYDGAGGVYQALLVVPDDEHPDRYLVVDGNLRLAAGQYLGPKCPPLKCELIDAGRAQQLLIMAATSAFHYAKNPIEEARHYKRLQEQGYSTAQIARSTGLSQSHISGRLHWLHLDGEIQDHVAAGRLPRDKRVADALLGIDDEAARLKLAGRLAGRQAPVETCLLACQRLADQLRQQRDLKANRTPSLALSGTAHAHGKSDWPSVRQAARDACNACNIHQEALVHVAEPAWELITHAAGDTCAACNLRELEVMCAQCPAVELLKRLSRCPTKDEGRTTEAPHSSSVFRPSSVTRNSHAR